MYLLRTSTRIKTFIPKSWVKYRSKDVENTFYNDFTER